MNEPKNYTVIGAGNGGRAMAAHLSFMGYAVTLYNRTFANIAEIKSNGGLKIQSSYSKLNGFVRLALVTSDLQKAVKRAQIIMVVLPASAHKEIATKMREYIQEGQIIILHPGRTFGALEFAKALGQNKEKVTIAEAETLLYISRSEGLDGVKIFRIKDEVPMAAFPSTQTKIVLDKLISPFPQFVDGLNVLRTGLNNMGAMLHPALTLLNTGWIESTHGEYEFYRQGMTRSIAKVIERIDQERLCVASSLGFRVESLLEWLKNSYNISGSDLCSAIRSHDGYAGIKAPDNINHRYVSDDIPTGLVPMASLAKANGVSVQGIETIIRLASIINNIDYWKCGRTLEGLGLSNMNLSQLIQYVTNGSL